MAVQMYTMEYKVSDRWYKVVATDAMLQDLCMGPAARQNQQKVDNRLRLDAGDTTVPIDPPRAEGELKGVTVRFVGTPAPFNARNTRKKEQPGDKPPVALKGSVA